MTAQTEPKPIRWQIVLLQGDVAVQTYPIRGEIFTIGRDSANSLSLDNPHISKRHARIFRQHNLLFIEDLQSVNGVQVNGLSIVEPHPLQAGDIITIGPFTLRLETRRSLVDALPLSKTLPPITAQQAEPASSEDRWLFWAAIIGAAGLVILLLAGITGLWLWQTYLAPNATPAPTPTVVSAGPTIVINKTPPGEVIVNQSVTLQATASDPIGIARMEFWVNDQQIDSVVNQLDQPIPAMTTVFRWVSDSPGMVDLRVKAVNNRGQEKTIAAATVRVIAPDTPTPAPSFTPPPSPATGDIAPTSASPTPTEMAAPTATASPVSTQAVLTILEAAVNVRAGPGLSYERVTTLLAGEEVAIIGQADVGQGEWWLVQRPDDEAALGWVANNPELASAANTDAVPVVAAPPTPTPTLPPSPTLTPTPTPVVLRAPEGNMLLIASNRSIGNQPLRLTLSGGKSVGGGKEIDLQPGEEIQITLEPDVYHSLWSSPYRSFAYADDFDAIANKVMVMWAIPETGETGREIYDALVLTPSEATSPTATPTPAQGTGVAGSETQPGKALLILSNRSFANQFASVTISGERFGGGEQFILNANTEQRLDLEPGHYWLVWSTPTFAAGNEFDVNAGEVLEGWIVPENGQVFMRFPGQEPRQINN